MSLQKHNHSDGQRNNSASIALNTRTSVQYIMVYIQQFLNRKAGLQFIFDQYEVLCVYKSITFLSTAAEHSASISMNTVYTQQFI